MGNVDKMQEVSEENKNETPDEVQNDAELTNDEKSIEDHEVGEASHVVESKQGLKGVEENNEGLEAVKETEATEEEAKDESLETIDAEDQDAEVDTEQDDEHHEEEEMDFSHSSKDELLAKVREVRNEDNMQYLDKVLKAVKPRFDELYEFTKNEALQRFVSDGNEADAFEFHGDEADKEFIALYGQLRAKRNKHFKDQQNLREDNLKKKENLLEQLRQIIDGEESINSIDAIRELQAEWKKTGPVPGSQNKTLWANYNALLDRYYDNRSIYFELKDLDRKKNMEQKRELCERAEALLEIDDLKTAIVQLNELHEEYKHIGPVSKEYQEPLWQRFKSASDAIYSKRKEYFDELKGQFEANLIQKEELIKELEGFTQFKSDRITEWNGKTKELLDIQKRWEAIGGVPKEKAKAINKAFWNPFKQFFANKNQFFKELESKREENLLKKQELIARAEELKSSDKWDSIAQKLKNLQAEWKEIGPVPEKVRNETYARFKTACDDFFNRRRDQNKEKFKEFDSNLKIKLQVCDQIEELSVGKELNLDDAYDLIDNYTSIGFVPKNAIKKINQRFDEVVGKLLANEGLDEEDRIDLKNYIVIERLKSTPGGERKIQRKEQSIRRKIAALESDISTWNTNIDFFAKSATADKLRAEMQEKINAAGRELQELRDQLNSIS